MIAARPSTSFASLHSVGNSTTDAVARQLPFTDFQLGSANSPATPPISCFFLVDESDASTAASSSPFMSPTNSITPQSTPEPQTDELTQMQSLYSKSFQQTLSPFIPLFNNTESILSSRDTASDGKRRRLFHRRQALSVPADKCGLISDSFVLTDSLWNKLTFDERNVSTSPSSGAHVPLSGTRPEQSASARLHELLCAHPFFAALWPSLCEHIYTQMKRVRYSANALLFASQEQVDRFYVIDSGSVQCAVYELDPLSSKRTRSRSIASLPPLTPSHSSSPSSSRSWSPFPSSSSFSSATMTLPIAPSSSLVETCILSSPSTLSDISLYHPHISNMSARALHDVIVYEIDGAEIRALKHAAQQVHYTNIRLYFSHHNGIRIGHELCVLNDIEQIQAMDACQYIIVNTTELSLISRIRMYAQTHILIVTRGSLTLHRQLVADRTENDDPSRFVTSGEISSDIDFDRQTLRDNHVVCLSDALIHSFDTASSQSASIIDNKASRKRGRASEQADQSEFTPPIAVPVRVRALSAGTSLTTIHEHRHIHDEARRIIGNAMVSSTPTSPIQDEQQQQALPALSTSLVLTPSALHLRRSIRKLTMETYPLTMTTARMKNDALLHQSDHSDQHNDAAINETKVRRSARLSLTVDSSSATVEFIAIPLNVLLATAEWTQRLRHLITQQYYYQRKDQQ